jgi:hypothetical protein
MPPTAYRRANSLDHVGRRARVVRRNALANVFKSAKIAGSTIRAVEASPWRQQPVIPLLGLFLGERFVRVQLRDPRVDLLDLPLV